MNALIFGATGMIGGGVLTECLDDDYVESVVSVGRAPSGRRHAKLREVLVPNLFDLREYGDALGPFDAVLYCLGVSSAGMSEAEYRRVTYDLTVAVADVVEGLNPRCRFCFISGQGSGSGRAMWARVKGEAEQALLERPFATHVFRPGLIQPVKRARSRTPLYRVIYTLVGPALPILRRLMPGAITTTEILGRAMIRVAANGHERRVLEPPDINAVGG